jgi:hypothetical protein
LPLRDQAAEEVLFSTNRYRPTGYNENGNLRIGALLYSRIFVATLWEITFVFIGLPGLSGE